METNSDSNNHPAPIEPQEQQNREAQPVGDEQPPRLPFPVVGIGASAGGWKR